MWLRPTSQSSYERLFGLDGYNFDIAHAGSGQLMSYIANGSNSWEFVSGPTTEYDTWAHWVITRSQSTGLIEYYKNKVTGRNTDQNY